MSAAIIQLLFHLSSVVTFSLGILTDSCLPSWWNCTFFVTCLIGIFPLLNYQSSKWSGKHSSSRPEEFCKKGVLGNFAKFTGKYLCQRLFFNKVAGLRHRCFPVNFAKFLRTPFCTEHLQWLLSEYLVVTPDILIL